MNATQTFRIREYDLTCSANANANANDWRDSSQSW